MEHIERLHHFPSLMTNASCLIAKLRLADLGQLTHSVSDLQTTTLLPCAVLGASRPLAGL